MADGDGISTYPYPIDHVDISTVEPNDTPIWDALLRELVSEDQHSEFPFGREDFSFSFGSDDGDRVEGNDDDDDGDERDSARDENSPAEEG